MTLVQWFEREGLGEKGLDARAKRLGLPRTTVWRLQRKDHRPDMKTVKHVARKTSGAVRFEDWTGA